MGLLMLILAVFFLVVLSLAIARTLFAEDKVPNVAADVESFVDVVSAVSITQVPSLVHERGEVHLSVVVPAYNEEKRIAPMLRETLVFLEAKKYTYEVIVVDDGCTDATFQVVESLCRATQGGDHVRYLKMSRNHGKGGAVRTGMLCSRGELLLMADADAATTFSDVERLEGALRGNRSIAVGSRAHKQQDAVANRAWYRTVLMYGFHLFVRFAGVAGIQDTQCGFKLFTRDIARIIFPRMHLERWAFDVEMLYIAQHAGGVTIAEVPVNWEEIGGSHLDPLAATIEMLIDITKIRAAYLLGVYKIWPSAV